MQKRNVFAAALLTAAFAVGASGASADPLEMLDAVADAPGATTSTAADLAGYEQQFVADAVDVANASVTCRLIPGPANGVPQKDLVVAVTKAQDIAEGQGACASLEPEGTSYSVILEIAFQQYDNGVWTDIAGTDVRCQRPSIAGQGAVNCIAHKIYQVSNDGTPSKLHRARFTLISPLQRETYSPPFLQAPVASVES